MPERRIDPRATDGSERAQGATTGSPDALFNAGFCPTERALASDGGAKKCLFIDNFDSFTYNLVDYVSAHAETEVLLNTASLEEVRAADPGAIVISPGPGHPENERDVGVTLDVLREVSPRVPTLGVCLGLEAAVYAYGGSVERAPDPVHGKAFRIEHDGRGVYAGLDQGFEAGRYHSLVAVDVPDCFEVTATTDHDGEELVMGIRHREHPIECVQFHPESVLTAAGHDVIRNFVTRVVSAPTAGE